LVIRETLNFKLYTNLLHVPGVAHHDPTSRIIASEQVRSFDVKSDLKLLFEFKVPRCKILVEET
jgi:hypothetical protein